MQRLEQIYEMHRTAVRAYVRRRAPEEPLSRRTAIAAESAATSTNIPFTGDAQGEQIWSWHLPGR